MFWSSFGGKPMVTSNHQFFVSLSANYFEWFASNDCRTYPVLNVALFFHLLMKWNLALQCLQIFYCSFWCWLLFTAQTCENSHYYNDVKIKWNTGEIQWHCDALRWNGIQGQAKWNTGTIYVGDSRNTGEIAAFKGEVGLASPTIYSWESFLTTK